MKYMEWRKILLKGIDGKATYIDQIDMCFHSKDWNCCAVGAKLMCDLKVNEIKTVDRGDMIHSIINKEIYNLGNREFPLAIRDEKYEEALKILDKIYKTENIYRSEKAKQNLIKAEKE